MKNTFYPQLRKYVEKHDMQQTPPPSLSLSLSLSLSTKISSSGLRLTGHGADMVHYFIYILLQYKSII